MTINNLETPVATAILYKNDCAAFGFLSKDVLDFLDLLNIYTLFDILINKYTDRIEFMINVVKTEVDVHMLDRDIQFFETIKKLRGISIETIKYSFTEGEEFDYITVKCMLNGVNK